MKKDKLEEYISQHRSEFDQESPPPMVWMNLEKHLDNEKNKGAVVRQMRSPGLMRVMQIAAMFVVVMGVGLIIGLQLNKGNTYSSPQLQEFVEAEKHYSKEVDKMWTVVKASGVEEEASIQEDLNSLDAVYNELKNELISEPNANTEHVINAMINNYRSKIDILETVLNKHNEEKTNNQQKIIENEQVEI